MLMINIKILLILILILFYTINYKFLIEQIKSLFSKFKKNKLVLFGKKIKKNRKNYILFHNFRLISWTILILIIVLFIFPNNFVFTGKCDYSLINGEENKCKTPSTKDLTINHAKERVLNKENYLPITVYGRYNDSNTKKVIKYILEHNQKAPEKIKFSFVSVDEDKLTKNMICLYSKDMSKYWAMLNIHAKYNYLTEEILNGAYKRLNINFDSFEKCRNGPFVEEKLKLNEDLIEKSNIYAIPTIFIGEKTYIGYNSFKDNFI